MDENLIIPENYPELMQMFIGEEIYLVNESQWYESIPSEGGNKYRFLNVFSHAGNEIIPEEKRDFFFKMVNAIRTDRIQMDADGFAAINVQNCKGLKWKNLEHLFSPRYCIFWGADPNTMDVPCKPGGGTVVNDCRILYFPSLDKVDADTDMKRQLWNYMQRMFGMTAPK